MKISNSKKDLNLKTLLFLVVFFISTITIISKSYTFSNKNEFLEDLPQPNIEYNEENTVFIPKLYSEIYLGITRSQLQVDNSFEGAVSLGAILFIATLTIIIKKYKKFGNNEVKVNTVNHQISKEISTQELLVLNSIQEYLSKNRYLEVNKIIPYLNARLSKSEPFMNKNGIQVAINNLIKKNIIVDGSKLTQDDILKNSNRLKIYNTILNNPGIHFMYIINLLGMSIFLVKWHLNMLLKFNFIKKTDVENREIYYDSSLSEENAKILHFMGRERTLKIINYLKKNPNGSPKYRISKDLKMHQNTVSKYIQKLEELEILSRKNLTNKTLYFLKNPSLF
ncbi:MAG: hypothetical protein ACFFC3_04835 [Candidatus Odinarchaeota archaeon]